jgi:diacylglycerol kinase family enzyme
MRFLALVNPLSGARQGATLIEALNELKRSGSFPGDVEAFDFPNLKAQIQKSASYDALLIGGGDGTISRLLPLLKEIKIKIGMLPIGTGNDLCKELGVFKLFSLQNVLSLLRAYQEAPVKTFRLGKITLRGAETAEIPFCNYLSFGFDAATVSGFSALRSKYGKAISTFGKLGNRFAYGAAGLKNIFITIPPHTALKNLSTAESFDVGGSNTLIFANIKSYTGLGRSNSVGSAFDDKLECVRVRNSIEYARIFSTGLVPLTQGGAFELDVKSTIAMQIDGESFAPVQAPSISIGIDGSLDILVPV